MSMRRFRQVCATNCSTTDRLLPTDRSDGDNDDVLPAQRYRYRETKPAFAQEWTSLWASRSANVSQEHNWKACKR